MKKAIEIGAYIYWAVVGASFVAALIYHFTL